MNQQILDKVLESPRLPSLPAIAIEVIELVQHQDVKIRQIADTIQHDPALSTKILKTVNSSFYGQAHAVSTVSHALVVLGLNAVKSLALGFTLVHNLQKSASEGMDHMAFWRRSLYAAVAARQLAAKAGMVQHEEAFLGGLLQDLGLLAMSQTLGPDYAELVRQVGADHRLLRDLEQEHLDNDHAEIGGALADKWRLPPLLVDPIRHHEDTDAAPEAVQPLVRCVALGGRVADIFMTDSPGKALNSYYRSAEEWFELPTEQAEPLLKTIHMDSIEVKRLFDLPTGALENADDILAHANEALANLSLQQQQQQTELAQKNGQLTKEVNTDSLTGAANRRRFNQFITESFRAVTQGAEPVSLLFLDADHFKRFNDTYGHQTGDRVLVELASTLKSTANDEALVARYGGEEFAVVLPGTDRLKSAKLAEKTRKAIETMTVTSDEGESLTVTASIGVSTFDGQSFDQVEQFIKAADQAVYAAKASGRNCVRIFTPRPKTASVA